MFKMKALETFAAYILVDSIVLLSAHFYPTRSHLNSRLCGARPAKKHMAGNLTTGNLYITLHIQDPAAKHRVFGCNRFSTLPGGTHSCHLERTSTLVIYCNQHAVQWPPLARPPYNNGRCDEHSLCLSVCLSVSGELRCR